MKIGVVDVGGGFRGIYACGVLDYCLENNIKFDLGIGVSAGSANLASFTAGQKGRNYVFYTKYGARKQYASLRNFIFKKSFIDMDYVYSFLSNQNGENPLNYSAIKNNPMELLVVAANAITGKTKYFTKNDIRQDEYDIFKASSSIPFICKPFFIKNTPYYDGALADPVPIEKAFSMGCDKVVVLLTRPIETPRSSSKDEKLAKFIKKKYPLAAERLCLRAKNYNQSVEKAKLYQKQGKALIIAPKNTFGVNTLSRDKAALDKLYNAGLTDAKILNNFINQ